MDGDVLDEGIDFLALGEAEKSLLNRRQPFQIDLGGVDLADQEGQIQESFVDVQVSDFLVRFFQEPRST